MRQVGNLHVTEAKRPHIEPYLDLEHRLDQISRFPHEISTWQPKYEIRGSASCPL